MNRAATPGAPFAPNFRRASGRAGVRKPVKKVRLRFRHVLLLLGGTALFFVAAYETYSFVIGWPKLAVRTVEVVCADSRVGGLVSQAAAEARWGNILALDLDSVRREVQTIPWVREARVRKIFPSTLAIDVEPRRPAAWMRAETDVLLDAGGYPIETGVREARPELPLLTEEGRFAAEREDKVRRAFACLDDLSPEVRARIDFLDCTEPADIVIRFREDPTLVHLGDGGFGARAAEYLAGKAGWERTFGPLEYVYLWFADRVILKPVLPAPVKEAL